MKSWRAFSAAVVLVTALLCDARRHMRRNSHHRHHLEASRMMTRQELHGGGLYAVDLTHTLNEMAPLTKDGSPLEAIRERLDDGYGAR